MKYTRTIPFVQWFRRFSIFPKRRVRATPDGMTITWIWWEWYHQRWVWNEAAGRLVDSEIWLLSDEFKLVEEQSVNGEEEEEPQEWRRQTDETDFMEKFHDLQDPEDGFTDTGETSDGDVEVAGDQMEEPERRP